MHQTELSRWRVADLDCGSSARSNAEDGFTRTDLLAILVVAGFLGLLMLPALASSHDNGGRTVCVSNLRQLGAALQMYASDNRDWMAYPNWLSETGVRGWLYTGTNGFPPAPTSGDSAYRTGLWFAYVRMARTYVCPVDVESRYYTQRYNRLSSYVMNGAVCGYALSTTSICKITDPWNPGCYLLWTPDEEFGSPAMGAFAFNDASSYPDRNEGPGRIHSPNGSDLLTVRGDVPFVTYSKYQTEQATGSRSLAWWNPSNSSGH